MLYYQEYSKIKVCKIKRIEPFQKFLSIMTGNSKTENNSLITNIPKITDNSINLYTGGKVINLNKFLRFIETPLILSVILVNVFTPVLLKFGAFWILGGNAFVYSLSKRLASRVDYLPNLEKISVSKVGLFGIERNSLWDLKDIEKVDFSETVYNMENYYWRIHIKKLDKHMVFRNKKTKEILMFENSGMWNWEGISHPHINDNSFFNK